MSTVTIERAPERTPERTEQVTRRDVLLRAIDVLQEFGWCQGAGARDEHGRRVNFIRDGVSFCLWGSTYRAAIDFGLNAQILYGMKGIAKSPLWNDDPERTKDEVIAHLRELVDSPEADVIVDDTEAVGDVIVKLALQKGVVI